MEETRRSPHAFRVLPVITDYFGHKDPRSMASLMGERRRSVEGKYNHSNNPGANGPTAACEGRQITVTNHGQLLPWFHYAGSASTTSVSDNLRTYLLRNFNLAKTADDYDAYAIAYEAGAAVDW